MKKLMSLILAALLALSALTAAFAATYEGNKDVVTGVQYALNKAGYDCGKPDGSAGKKTAAAITQFETDHGLEANGVIDDALLKALWDNSVDDTLKEAIEKVSSEETFDYSNPDSFVTLYNELMARVYRFYWGEYDFVENDIIQYLRISNDEENRNAQEIPEENLVYVDYSGMYNALGFACDKAEDVYAINGKQTNFVVSVDPQVPGLSFTLETVAAYIWTYATAFHKGDVSLANADLKAALDQFGFTGYWGGLSVEGWDGNPFVAEGYTIQMLYNSNAQQLIFRAVNDGAEGEEQSAGEAEPAEGTEPTGEAEATEEAEPAEETEPAGEDEATEEAEAAEEAEPAEQADSGNQIDEMMVGAKDLHYKQGEDLLIGEKDGFRVTLKGEQPDYGNFIENWNAYEWYTLEIKNDTDKTYGVKAYSQIDGTVVDDFNSTHESTGYVGHSTEEMKNYLHADDFVNETGEADENAWLSAINSPREWRLVIEICEVTWSGYDSETGDTLTTLDPVIIHFDSVAAAEAGESTETAETGATEPARVYTDKDTVKKVQQALNDAGYNCGTPDGIAGKKTAAAIIQYRTDKGLDVSETIDDALMEAMGIAVP